MFGARKLVNGNEEHITHCCIKQDYSQRSKLTTFRTNQFIFVEIIEKTNVTVKKTLHEPQRRRTKYCASIWYKHKVEQDFQLLNNTTA